MNQTVTLLNCIAQNALMGFHAVDTLLSKTADTEFRRELLRERQVYADLRQDAEARMNAQDAQPTPKPAFDKVGAWVGLEMSTLTDRSNAHFADLVIQGANMGVIEANEIKNTCPEASAEAQGVASNFITAQQEIIQTMKPFLHK